MSGSARPTVPRELALLNGVSPAKYSKNPCCRCYRNHHPSQTLAKAAATEAAPPGAPDTATLRRGQKGRTTKNGIGHKYAPCLSRRTSNKSTQEVALTLIPCAGQRGSGWELRARAQWHQRSFPKESCSRRTLSPLLVGCSAPMCPCDDVSKARFLLFIIAQYNVCPDFKISI